MSIQRATDAEGLFAHLGGSSIVVFQALVGAADQYLIGAESAHISTMAPSRRAAFTAGRAAAHAGLAHLGIVEQALVIGPGGQPAWPTGVTGSITHTGRLAFAAITTVESSPDAGRSPIAIGIDAEERGRIDGELVPMIMTAGERSVWAGLTPAAADAFATLTFSAKEALYKAQFAFTGAWLGFEHVAQAGRPGRDPLEIERLGTAPDETGTKPSMEPTEIDLLFDDANDSPLDPSIERPLRARSLVSTDQVLSAVVLRRPASRTRSR